ncbi:ATP-binding protein [Candidatus Desantisbacteria bacterium]|nr:ATP-binding protein [Candidatus Desantisbacteria bacterium]
MIQFIFDGAKKVGFDDAALNQIHLASEEVLINIINYAYPDKPGDIEISYEIENGQIIIEISDSGLPFDPLKKPDPDITLSLEERDIGGLGIFLTKKIMNEVIYRRENNKNILTMIKCK